MQLDPKQAGNRIKAFEQRLVKQVIGQPEASRAVVDVYRMALAGLSNPDRPLGTLLLLGPTGTGKTKVVESTASALFGKPHCMLKVDCAEFQHSHEIAKLLGSPPGYLGHRETSPYFNPRSLTQYMTEDDPFVVVLFDEIEKASDSLWNLLLGILDKGNLTLGDNTRVSFRAALIFMTSNLGAREIAELTDSHRGFSPVQGNAEHRQITDTAIAAARRKFSPEFMNRIDKTVVFRQLSNEDLKQILELELSQLQERIHESNGKSFYFDCTDQVKQRLMQEGFDSKSGARNLKRVIERRLVFPFSNLLITEQVGSGDLVLVETGEGDEFTFTRINQKIPFPPAGQAASNQVEDF